MNPRTPASVYAPRLRTILTVFRLVVFTCLTPAFGGDVQQPPPELQRVLAVSVTVVPETDIAASLNERDLEHLVVSELKDHQITAVPYTSIEDTLENNEGLYVLDIIVDEAEIAQRPYWEWWNRRYRDDEILHLEISLTATEVKDEKTLGTINFSRDYRAEDYGRFSSPQAVRGAVYEALTNITSKCAHSLSKGDFGADLETFQHPFALDDALDYWRDLSLKLKVLAVFLSFLALVLVGALVAAVLEAFFTGIARLLRASTRTA